MIYYSTKGINIIGLCKKKNFIKYESCKGSMCNPNFLFHKFLFVPTFDFDQMGSLIHLHFTFLQHSAITVLEKENMNMIG